MCRELWTTSTSPIRTATRSACTPSTPDLSLMGPARSGVSGQGEDLGAVLGDRDGVLAVRGAAARCAAEGPAVGVGDQFGGVDHDPRLQGQQQPGAQPVAAT